MEFSVQTNILQLMDQLDELASEQLPYASAVTLTRVAQKTQFNEIEVMKRVFDRPTKFTLNSLFVETAKKHDWPKQSARVWFKDKLSAPKGTAPDDYLMSQVKGGIRKHKRSEKALIAKGIMRSTEYMVPGSGAQLDNFGNMKRSQIVRILSDLRAFSEVGFLANRTNSKRSVRRARKSQYFFAEIDGQRGIWQKVKSSFGDGIKCIALFVEKSPRYRKRFAFFEIADNSFKAHYDRIFKIELDNALRTAKRDIKLR